MEPDLKSDAIICHGCGQLVDLPEGYRRNKIQCPDCGVISPVTAPVARSDRPAKAAAKPKEQPASDDDQWAAEFLSTPEPPRAPEPVEEEPASPAPDEDLAPIAPRRRKRRAAPEPEKKPAFEMKFPCRRCGAKVVRQGECPYCDGATPAPSQEVIPNLSLDAPPDPDEEDGTPYELDGAGDVPCPKCTNMLPPGGVVCTRCGWHLRRRKKLVKTYQPLVRSWETNHSLKTRQTIWAGLQLCAFVAGLIANLLMADPAWISFVFSMFGFAGMSSFLMGTFDRIDLVRNEKGKVTLTKTRRVCFIEAVTLPIDVRGHEGIVTGRTSEVSFWEWLVFFCLLPGIIPALFWWYYAIHKITYRASLARDHGYPAAIGYEGWDEKQMRDIAVTLSGAAGLRLDGI
jgi:hypothetical protein